jgi:hypothetical protein
VFWSARSAQFAYFRSGPGRQISRATSSTTASGAIRATCLPKSHPTTPESSARAPNARYCIERSALDEHRTINAERSVLYVGRAGVQVGNSDSGLTHVDLRAGNWPIEIWVDEPDPADVGRVVFVLTEPSA